MAISSTGSELSDHSHRKNLVDRAIEKIVKTAINAISAMLSMKVAPEIITPFKEET
jgi:hypothetical protein